MIENRRIALIDESVSYLIAKLAPNWKIGLHEAEYFFVNRAANKKIGCNLSAIEFVKQLDGKLTLAEVAVNLGDIFKQDPTKILSDIGDTLLLLHAKDVVELNDVDGIVQRQSLFEKLPDRYKASSDIDNPFNFFDAIFCINMLSESTRWREMQSRFVKLGIIDRVIRFDAVETPSSHHIGCTLSHRLIVELAQKNKFRSILVFEDDALMLDTILQLLPKSLDELAQQRWKLFYLGGSLRYDTDRDLVECNHLKRAKLVTCTHAIAYSERSYEQIVEEIPNDITGLLPWMKANAAIDQYLTRQVSNGYLAFPTLSVQHQNLAWEQSELVDRYL